MTRYHPLLVVLHWLMVPMTLMALMAGNFMLDPIPNNSPEKVMALTGHMSFGLIIGVLLIARLITRVKSTKPAAATAGNALLDRIGVMTHWAFYALIAGMVLSGIGIAMGAGLFDIVFGGSGAAVPAAMEELAPRIAHGILGTLLVLLVILHVAAAIYHHFILKDGLLRRMWFGRRN